MISQYLVKFNFLRFDKMRYNFLNVTKRDKVVKMWKAIEKVQKQPPEVFLKISQNWQGNTSIGVSLQMKM